MTNKISPTAIGAFVVATFGVLIMAVVIVAGGSLRAKPKRFICLFEGGVNGLKVGAPVKFKGVQIGTVEEIKLVLGPDEGTLRSGNRFLRRPVIIGIDRSLIVQRGGTGQALTTEGVEGLIQNGLRAQLDTESLLTGLLYIDLDLHPNSPVTYALEPGSGSLTEIPTVPTTIEALQKQATEAIAKLGQVDFNRLVSSITQAADSINELTSDPQVRATIGSFRQTVMNLDQTLTSVRAAVDNVNHELNPLSGSLRKSSDEANATMRAMQSSLVQIQALMDSDSPLAVNMNNALEQLSDTSRAIEELTNYLQRNPAALVRGKFVPEKDK